MNICKLCDAPAEGDFCPKCQAQRDEINARFKDEIERAVEEFERRRHDALIGANDRRAKERRAVVEEWMNRGLKEGFR